LAPFREKRKGGRELGFRASHMSSKVEFIESIFNNGREGEEGKSRGGCGTRTGRENAGPDADHEEHFDRASKRQEGLMSVEGLLTGGGLAGEGTPEDVKAEGKSHRANKPPMWRTGGKGFKIPFHGRRERGSEGKRGLKRGWG